MDDLFPQMKKVTYAFLVLLLVLGTVVAVTVWLLRDAQPAPQPVVLSDGTTVRFVAVTHGTNHAWGNTRFARAVLRAPGPVRDLVIRAFPKAVGRTTRTTSEPRLVVWVEHWGPTGGATISRRAFLRPAGGSIAGNDEHLGLWNQPSNAVSLASLEFGAWPRHTSTLECALFEADANYDFTEVGSFPFRNPAPSTGAATNWAADPLPATVLAGDLKVTLQIFAAGLGNSSTHRAKADGEIEIAHAPVREGGEPGAFVAVDIDSPRGTNESWIMFDADLSDPDGNEIGATSRSGMSTRMRFHPVLWSDSSPWKLRLHLKRSKGFASGELVAFSNLPLPAIGTTNRFDLTNSIGDIDVVLRHFVRRPDLTNNSWSSGTLSELRIEHTQLGATNQLDMIGITAQPAGTNLATQGSSWSDDYHEYSFSHFPAGTTHLDLTVAVQPTRFAEFTVEPNWVTNEVVVTEKR